MPSWYVGVVSQYFGRCPRSQKPGQCGRGVDVLASRALDSLSSLMGEVGSDSALCRPGLAERVRDNVMEQSKSYVARGGRAARGGAVARERMFSPACPQAGGGVPSSVSGETRGFYVSCGTQLVCILHSIFAGARVSRSLMLARVVRLSFLSLWGEVHGRVASVGGGERDAAPAYSFSFK